MSGKESLPIDGSPGYSPWICHVCGTSFRGESAACDVCYRTACSAHLRRTTIFNKESGLYEFVSVCFDCAAAEMLG